jgi:hypothetical protein
MLKLLIVLAFICASTGVYGFVQYARYRMKGDERKETFYKNLHYIALTLLFVIGVIVMLYMGEYSD